MLSGVVVELLPDYTATHYRRQYYSFLKFCSQLFHMKIKLQCYLASLTNNTSGGLSATLC
jgi:hypothetical protein